MNYYNFHVGDYAAHTAHLTWEEDLIYRRLLDLYYLHERALAPDVQKLSRVIRMPKATAAIEAVLNEFFDLQADGWHNKRADAELDTMGEKKELSDERSSHEKERQRRYRERRTNMFEALRAVGVVPAWDISIKDLQRLHDENCNAPKTSPETDLQRNGDVSGDTPATAIPTPTPTPTPTPIEKKEERAQAPLPDWVPVDSWEGYAEMRKKIRKPMTPRARELVLKKLSAMREEGHDIADVLDLSTTNAWTDVYRPEGRAAKVSAPTPKGDIDAYCAAHRNATWWAEAGFANVYEATSRKCFHHNAAQFRDGKRCEATA